MALNLRKQGYISFKKNGVKRIKSIFLNNGNKESN